MGAPYIYDISRLRVKHSLWATNNSNTNLSFNYAQVPYDIAYLGWGSVIGIATRYELEGSGTESRWRQDFPHPSSPSLGLT